MASLRSFFGIGNKVNPTAAAAEPEGVKAPTAPAAPAPEVQLPPAKHAPAGGAQARSVGAQAGQRGNFWLRTSRIYPVGALAPPTGQRSLALPEVT
jgi:hypothetical protein